MAPKNDTAISDLSQQVALLTQSVVHLTEHMKRMELIINQWEKDTQSLNTRLVVFGTRLDPLEKQVATQWKRLDKMWVAFWVLAVSQIIIMLLLFGHKYIPLIKLP